VPGGRALPEFRERSTVACMAVKRAIEERLARLAAIANRASPSLAAELTPFLRDKTGVVVGVAAKVVGDHELRGLTQELEDAFERFFVNPVKTDPGCRAKLGVAEALRRLGANVPDLFLRALAYVQLEPSYGPPIDTAAPLRVCGARGLLESHYPFALLEVAPLLADVEPNARAGVAAVLGDVESEATEALLRLKVLAGDDEPDVVGACLQALLRSSFARSLPFVVESMKRVPESAVQLALLALGESHDERALAPLREHAETTASSDVRAAALLGMSLLRLTDANEYLLGLVEHGAERRALEVLRALAPQRFDVALTERVRTVVDARGGAVRTAFEAILTGK
jgi:HEAT repeat protein